jgi:TonB-dependent starch-binding outer membrane protein SusC
MFLSFTPHSWRIFQSGYFQLPSVEVFSFSHIFFSFKPANCMKLSLYSIIRGSVLALLLTMSTAVLAQQTLRGSVKDAKSGEALIGASVVITGTTKGTLTDLDGNFELNQVANDAQSLSVTYVGYATQVVPISGRTSFDVLLGAGSAMDEVIVIGYGSVKQREVTGSITSISNENFNKGNINDPTLLIQGKVPGLVVARPGGDPNGTSQIRLRGIATFGQSSSPLYVIDGFIVPSLDLIDPSDIERMDILKDGSACSIYGTQGTNGVILITTKRGTGAPKVTYNVQVANESIAKMPAVTNASEYKALGGLDLGSDTDWASEISQAGLSHTHNLGLSGGSRGTSYRVSANYRDVNGVLLNSGFKNTNVRAIIDQKALRDKLTLTAFAVSTRRNIDFSFTEAWRYAFITNPTLAPKDAANVTNGGYAEISGFEKFNPLGIVEQNSNEAQITGFQYGGRAALDIIKGLTFTNSISRQFFNFSRQEYYSKYAAFRGANAGGLAAQTSNNGRTDQFISTLQYDTKFGNTGLTLLGGYDFTENTGQGFAVQTGRFPTDGFTFNNLGSSSDVLGGLSNVNSGKEKSRVIAFFGRANVNLNDFVNISASLRREGSSKFGTGNKWGLFPGISAALDLNKFVKSDKIDALKLRVGYGKTGNIAGPAYRSLALYETGSPWPFNGGISSSWVPRQNPNPNLAWEIKDEYNVGIDFAAMDYRLTGTIDYYTRVTSNLIYEFGVPIPSNVKSTTLLNLGSLQNNGIEFNLAYDIIKKDDKHKWNSSINLTTFNTKLLKLSDESKGVYFAEIKTGNVGAPGLNESQMFIVREGQPLGMMYGPLWTGVIDTSTYLPDGMLNPKKGSPVLDSAQVIGNGLPKLAMGWNNTFTIGNLDFNFLIRGMFGHNLINQYRQFYENNNSGSIQGFNRVKTKYWNDDLTEAVWSSYYVEKGDFVSLDNITVGYTIPMPAGSAFSNVRIYANGNRLFYMTGYTGVDPDVRFTDVYDSDNGGRIESTGNPFAPGVDRRSNYLRTRSVAVGLSLEF